MARDASLEVIRAAYRKLAKKHHPDLNPGDAKAEARFKRLSAAHQLLTDPVKRARFDSGEIDAEGAETPRPGFYRDHAEGPAGYRYAPEGEDEQDVGSMFSAMFGERRGRRNAGPLHGEDRRYSLTAPFLDAVNGASTRLTLPDGRTLDVRIPPATADGATLRLRGQGGAGGGRAGGEGGVPGDALIEITVAPHAFFRRDGADIRLDLPVTLAEAALGGQIDVPTPGGPVRMRVPAGSDSLTQLRLRGRGVPAHGQHAAGVLIATLRVTIGTPDPALIAFLQGFTPEHKMNPRQAMEATA